MKIELDEVLSAKNRIDAYSSEGLLINATHYEGSLIITPDRIITNWPPRSPDDLAVQHIQCLIDTDPEVLLLGTGSQLRFPTNSVLEPLIQARIGFEVMDTGAACRAYNFIMGEGRRVVAALIKLEQD